MTDFEVSVKTEAGGGDEVAVKTEQEMEDDLLFPGGTGDAEEQGNGEGECFLGFPCSELCTNFLFAKWEGKEFAAEWLFEVIELFGSPKKQKVTLLDC